MTLRPGDNLRGRVCQSAEWGEVCPQGRGFKALLPLENEKDLEDIPANVREDLNIELVIIYGPGLSPPLWLERTQNWVLSRV